MQEIESERQALLSGQEQVDKFKQLLLKQRDIMITFTNRLNERDESIFQLQEELDAYDVLHNDTLLKLEKVYNRCRALEDLLRA